MPFSSRMQTPLSLQLNTPDGAPLYPVVKMRLSLTITAPTCLPSRWQLDQPETSFAISINLLSHLSIILPRKYVDKIIAQYNKQVNFKFLKIVSITKNITKRQNLNKKLYIFLFKSVDN